MKELIEKLENTKADIDFLATDNMWTQLTKDEVDFLLQALQQRYADKELIEENKRLKFMIDNGLGWEDMQNDNLTPPNK